MEDFLFEKAEKKSHPGKKKSQILDEKPEDSRKFGHVDLGID